MQVALLGIGYSANLPFMSLLNLQGDDVFVEKIQLSAVLPGELIFRTGLYRIYFILCLLFYSNFYINYVGVSREAERRGILTFSYMRECRSLTNSYVRSYNMNCMIFTINRYKNMNSKKILLKIVSQNFTCAYPGDDP